MKILLGSHGVGKTTLLQEVAKHFPDYYVTDGFSRPVFKIGRILDFSDVEKQIVINELSTWAYVNYLKHKNVISTRSIIDCIIYSRILVPEVDVTPMISLFDETKDQVEQYFYIPVEFGFVADEDRLNHELQVKIDNIIREFIDQHIPGDKLITIFGSVDQRLKQISAYL